MGGGNTFLLQSERNNEIQEAIIAEKERVKDVQIQIALDMRNIPIQHFVIQNHSAEDYAVYCGVPPYLLGDGFAGKYKVGVEVEEDPLGVENVILFQLITALNT